MIDPVVLLAPILLLGVIALVGFVGCQLVFQLDRDPPKPPANIHVIEGDGSVTLSWDPDIAADQYELKRKVGLPGVVPDSYDPLEIINKDELPTIDGQLTYLDEENVTNGVTYHYIIIAVNPDKRSKPSEDIEATPHSPFGPFITEFMPGTPRAGEEGWFGIAFLVLSQAVTVQKLGRFYGPTNNGTHEIRIIDAATKQTLGTASVNPASETDSKGFKYGNVTPSGVPLQANSRYFVMSHEKLGGDNFLTQDTVVTEFRAEARIESTVESVTLVAFATTGVPDHAFGPVNFQF
jgi:hypothetical protein